ncbi:thiamine pyrophosphate-dependent dehydrogenase E1 component subunit alpha [Polyangium mundeleinium]|uniref:2-oxoisovalerate dehydrogenase subunit alpha n=1 Tax=Polyangium mundeleinium TaxID=2995306 RepID=A0ABT5EJW4_9BACT|nr:thiamine pyrophosphate-dependent dehydrogenase E1 component subunit alpha [Polyangium mundeleinium]MDC0741055.1 thiamine pyrophosphate-dependent dehydrogenase E1 component subunit alpha [Polyangium mundeleinium]
MHDHDVEAHGAAMEASATPAPRAAEAPDLGLLRVLRDDGSADPATDPGLSPHVLLRAYREMKRVRLIDTRMMLLQRQGRIHFAGECRGQEATPIATGLVLEREDWVFPALRESAIMLVRGFPLKSYIAQYFGNAGDVLKGRQMPSHMSGRAVNQVAWSSCMATQLPHAVGAAWAAKMRKDRSVVLGFVGDGGTSEPDFHNALNFAGVFKVPCVLVCQNNHWAISVPAGKQTASPTFAVKGRAYGVPSVRVDGNDVLAVYRVVSDAVARARAGGGPTFIESVTYRMGAHSSSDDPTRYRSQEEVDTWAQRDPIVRLRRHLVHRGLLDEAEEAALEDGLMAEISAAIQEVEALGPPARETLFDDVYAELPWHLAEQRAEVLANRPHPGSHDGGGGH